MIKNPSCSVSWSNRKYPHLVLLRLLLKNANSCQSRLLYSGSYFSGSKGFFESEMGGIRKIDFAPNRRLRLRIRSERNRLASKF